MSTCGSSSSRPSSSSSNCSGAAWTSTGISPESSAARNASRSASTSVVMANSGTLLDRLALVGLLRLRGVAGDRLGRLALDRDLAELLGLDHAALDQRIDQPAMLLLVLDRPHVGV